MQTYPALIVLILAFGTSAYAADTPTEDPQAKTAVEAYEQEDAGPVENWFGCPPTETSDGDAQHNENAEKTEEHCDPDHPQNDSPQKAETTEKPSS